MALKRIGAIWENQDSKSKTRYSGKLDLGALGDIDIIIFDNDKKEDNHPDLTIHLITKDKPEKS